MTDSIYQGDVSNLSRHKFAHANPNNVASEVSTLSNIVLNRSLGWDIEIRNLEVGIEYYSVSLKRPVLLKLAIPELIIEDKTKNSTYEDDGTDTIVLEKHVRMKTVMLYLCEFLFYKGDPLDIPILEIPEIKQEGLKLNETNLKIHLSKSNLNLKKIDLDLHFNFMRLLVNPYNLQIIMQIAYEFLQESNVSEYFKSSFFDIKDIVDSDMKECVKIVQPNEFKNSPVKSGKIVNIKAFVRKVLVTLAYENLIFPDTEAYFQTPVKDISSPPVFACPNITMDISELNFQSDNFVTTILEIANLSISELINGETNKILFFSKTEEMVPDFKLTIANTTVDKKMNVDVKIALGQVNAIIDIELYSRIANYLFVFSHFTQVMALILKQQHEKLLQADKDLVPSIITSNESEKKDETYSSIKIKSPCVSLSLIFPSESQNLPYKENPIISIDCFKFKIFTRMISTNNGQEYEICFSSFNSYYQSKLEDPKIPIISINSMSKIETKVPLRIQTKSINKNNKNKLGSFSLSTDDYNVGLADDLPQTKEDEFNNLRYQAMEDSEITVSLVLPPFWFEMGRQNFHTIKKLIGKLPQYFNGSHDPALDYKVNESYPSEEELTFHDAESDTEFYSGDEELPDPLLQSDIIAIEPPKEPIKFGFHFVCSGGIIKLYEGDILDSNSLELSLEDLTVLFGSSLQSKGGSSLLAMTVSKLTLNYNVVQNEDQSQLYYLIQKKEAASKTMISLMIENKLNLETITSVSLIGVSVDHPISTDWFDGLTKFFQSDDPLLENTPPSPNVNVNNSPENDLVDKNSVAKSHLELNLENLSISVTNIIQKSSLTLEVNTIKLVNELDSNSYRFNLIFSKVDLFVSKYIEDCKIVKKKNIGQANSLNVEIILSFIESEVGFLVSVENHDLKLFGCADSIRTVLDVISGFESGQNTNSKQGTAEELEEGEDGVSFDGLDQSGKRKIELDDNQFQEVPQNLKKEFEEKYKTEIFEDDVLFEQKQISISKVPQPLDTKPDHLLKNPSTIMIPLPEKKKVLKEVKKMVPRKKIISKTVKVACKKPNEIDEEDEFGFNMGDECEVEQTIQEEITVMEEVITTEWVEEEVIVEKKQEFEEIRLDVNQFKEKINVNNKKNNNQDFDEDFILREDEDQYIPPPDEYVNTTTNIPVPIVNQRFQFNSISPNSNSNSHLRGNSVPKSLPQIPVVRFLNSEDSNNNGFLHVIDNYILQKHKEQQKTSLLPSNGFPTPSTRILFKDITISLTIYGGDDWNDDREENNNISLEFNKISLQYDSYANHSRLYNRIGLTIFGVEVKDGVEDSNWLSLFLYDTTFARAENANFFSLILQTSFGPRGVLLKSCKLKILPILLNIEGNTLSFLIQFYNRVFYDEIIEDDQPTTPLNPEETYINEEIEMQNQQFRIPEEMEVQQVIYQVFSIDKINILLNIKPLSDAKRNLLEIVMKNRLKTDPFLKFIENIPFNIDNAKIELPPVRILDGIAAKDLIDEVVKQWDWMRRLPEVLAGIGPGHVIQKITKGFYDLFALPVIHYKKDGRVVTAVRRGIYSFVTEIVGETIHICDKVTTGTATLMENFIGNGDENVKKRSKYAEQPKNTKEGLNQAYGALTKRAKETANRVFHVPLSEYKRTGATGSLKTLATGVPTAVLAPFLAVTEVVSKLSQGTYNSYNPQNIIAFQHKYK